MAQPPIFFPSRTMKSLTKECGRHAAALPAGAFSSFLGRDLVKAPPAPSAGRAAAGAFPWLRNNPLARHGHPAPQRWACTVPAARRQLGHRSYSSSNGVSVGELVSCHPSGLLRVWEVAVSGAPAPAYLIEAANRLTSTPSPVPSREESATPACCSV